MFYDETVEQTMTMITKSIAPGSSVVERIVQEFVRLVGEGAVKPGDRIPSETELAETWRVGRSSLREAFRMFQLLGVIEAKPGRGTVLSNTAPLFAIMDWSRFSDAGSISDIVEARLALEPAIARLAAMRATESDLRAIEETIERGRQAIGKPDASIQASLDFHAAVAHATGNQTLALTTRLLRSLYFESTRLSRRNADNYHSLLASHEEIYAAIRGRDPERAASITADHLRQGISFVYESFADDTSGSNETSS